MGVREGCSRAFRRLDLGIYVPFSFIFLSFFPFVYPLSPFPSSHCRLKVSMVTSVMLLKRQCLIDWFIDRLIDLSSVHATDVCFGRLISDISGKLTVWRIAVWHERQTLWRQSVECRWPHRCQTVARWRLSVSHTWASIVHTQRLIMSMIRSLALHKRGLKCKWAFAVVKFGWNVLERGGATSCWRSTTSNYKIY